MNGPVDDGGFSTPNSPFGSIAHSVRICSMIKAFAIFHLCGEYADL